MPDRGDVSESGAASTGRRKPGGGASRSKQAPIPYATVVYGDGLSTLCNLDARLSHVLEYYQERVGHPKIDFITADKWMVVNAQNFLNNNQSRPASTSASQRQSSRQKNNSDFADHSGSSEDDSSELRGNPEDVRADDVMKIKTTYIVVKCLDYDINEIVALKPNPRATQQRDGSKMVPDEAALAKMLYEPAVSERFLNENGKDIEIHLPTSIKHRIYDEALATLPPETEIEKAKKRSPGKKTK